MGYTRKQIRIILLMAEGHSSTEISQQINITTGTVSNHRKRILSNSGCKNWCHFMALHGRTGKLDSWARIQELQQGSLGNATANHTE